MSDPLLGALRPIFGLDTFRDQQREAIEAVLSGRDTLVVMPTGGGKSLCYQLPSLLMHGTAVVVSPLISLMKDQVDRLNSRGVPAAALNSSISHEQSRQIASAMEHGELKLLYVAPERLETRSFVELLKASHVSLLAIDEAHCISEWGHDFRRSYRRIPAVYECFAEGKRPPVIALTATATPDVRDDIVRQLSLRDPLQIVTGFERPNIKYAVLRESRKDIRLIDIAHTIGRGMIVYVSSRAKADTVSLMLSQLGFAARAYHAGMAADARESVQTQFIDGTCSIIVATSAFGMGIDKSDVRAVVHYDMPGTLEAYYQESGRAGRDGASAMAILLYNPGDERIHEFMIARSYPDPETIRKVYEVLVSMARSEAGLFDSTSVFVTSAQIEAALERKVVSVTRILDLLSDAKVLEWQTVESDEEHLVLSPTSDRVRREEYLRRSKNSVQGRVFRHVVELAAQASEGGVTIASVSLTDALQIRQQELRTALRLLDQQGLLEVKRTTLKPSDAAVFSVRFLGDAPSWGEVTRTVAGMQDKREHALSKLDIMRSYATSWECRSAFILRYFGERTGNYRCGTCDVCTATSRAENR